MNDLVERLRDYRVWSARRSQYDPLPICAEAATALEAQDKEIEALRADLNIVEGVFTDVCDELGCKYDNEAALEAVATLRRERDEARAALKAFLPDPTMMDILWGDMDDEATGTHTVKLKHFRAARAVIEKDATNG